MFKMFSFASPARQLEAARSVLSHLAELLDAKFSVELWDGSHIALGREVKPNMAVAIHSPGVIGSLLRWPTLDNLVRHYATGRIEIKGGDLTEFFETIRVPKSRERMKKLRTGVLLKAAWPFLFAPADKAKPTHAFTGDEVARSGGSRNDRDYMHFHYDLGNEFYQLFLAPEMQYSCGYFTDWGNPLEQAQHDKMEMICRKLRLQAGERLLDIGCGWGGLVCHAARNYGVKAHGVTLSQAQHDFAQE